MPATPPSTEVASRLRLFDRCVVAEIAARSKNGVAHVSQPELAAALGVSVSAVHRAITKLQQLGGLDKPLHPHRWNKKVGYRVKVAS